MRLIDADALKESIPETEPDIFENCQICTTLMDYEVKDLINKQPTIHAPRWVRCDEAKPQNKTRCLLAIPTAVKSPDYKHYYEIGYYDGGHFTAYNSELGFIQLEPEWWMPIEPPKEDEHGN